jgi:hypothetical protein
MRSILCEVFPDGLYCWVKYASACYLLAGQYRCICPATTSGPTGASAGAARNGTPRGGVATTAPADAWFAHPKGSRRQASRWRPLTASRSLDLHLSSIYHSCSKCFFLASPHLQRPRRNCWPQPNHRSNLSIYSIYKETHSSDGSATHERHYAGWAADRDDAILRANELYRGRDSMEAALVIGNGPTEVEVIYRVDGGN